MRREAHRRCSVLSVYMRVTLNPEVQGAVGASGCTQAAGHLPRTPSHPWLSICLCGRAYLGKAEFSP